MDFGSRDEELAFIEALRAHPPSETFTILRGLELRTADPDLSVELRKTPWNRDILAFYRGLAPAPVVSGSAASDGVAGGGAAGGADGSTASVASGGVAGGGAGGGEGAAADSDFSHR